MSSICSICALFGSSAGGGSSVGLPDGLMLNKYTMLTEEKYQHFTRIE